MVVVKHPINLDLVAKRGTIGPLLLSNDSMLGSDLHADEPTAARKVSIKKNPPAAAVEALRQNSQKFLGAVSGQPSAAQLLANNELDAVPFSRSLIGFLDR